MTAKSRRVSARLRKTVSLMFGGANLDKSIDVVRWVYEAFSRGDVPAILASVANEVEVRRGSAGELFEYFHFRFDEILATRGDQDRPPRVPRLALRDIAEKGERLAHAD
jgi:hypothetical protein